MLLKVLVLGDSGVGKTSLWERYVRQTSGPYVPPKVTSGSSFSTKEANIDGQHVVMQIWDTAGQERFSSLSVLFYRSSDACILVCDVTHQRSLDRLDEWMEEFCLQADVRDREKFPFVVIANKVDCPESQRMISDASLAEWSKQHNNIPVFEASAIENSGVAEPFELAAQLALRNAPQRPKKPEATPVWIDRKPAVVPEKKKCC